MTNPDPEDEAFEELSLKQGHWQHTSGWRKKQIMETSMKSRQVFIALMIGKGYTPEELAWEGRKFSNPAITTRWNYFLLGWEMRGTQSTEGG